MKLQFSTNNNASTEARAPIRMTIEDAMFTNVTRGNANAGLLEYDVVTGDTITFPVLPTVGGNTEILARVSPAATTPAFSMSNHSRYNFKAEFSIDSIDDDGLTDSYWAGVAWGNPTGASSLRCHVRYRTGIGVVFEIETVVASVPTVGVRYLLCDSADLTNVQIRIGLAFVYWSGLGPDPQDSAPGDPGTDGHPIMWVEFSAGGKPWKYIFSDLGSFPVLVASQPYAYSICDTAASGISGVQLNEMMFTHGATFVFDTTTGDGGYNDSFVYHALNCRDESDGACKFLLRPQLFKWIDGDLLLNCFAGDSSLGEIVQSDFTSAFRKNKGSVLSYDVAPHNQYKTSLTETLGESQAGPLYPQVTYRNMDGDVSFSIIKPESSADELRDFTIRAARSGKIYGENTKQFRTTPEISWTNHLEEISGAEHGWASPVSYGIVKNVINSQQYKYCISKTIFIENQNVLLVYYINAGNDEDGRTFEHPSEILVDRYSTATAEIQSLGTEVILDIPEEMLYNPIIQATETFDPYISFKMVEVNDDQFHDREGETVYGSSLLFFFWTSQSDCENRTISFVVSYDNGETWSSDAIRKVQIGHFEVYEELAQLCDFDVDYVNGRFAFAVSYTDSTTRIRSENFRVAEPFIRTFTIDGALLFDSATRETNHCAPATCNLSYPHHDFFSNSLNAANVNLVRPKIKADKKRGNFWMVVHDDRPESTAIRSSAFVYASSNGSSWYPVFIPTGHRDDNIVYSPDETTGEVSRDYTRTDLDPEYGFSINACDVLHHEDGFLYVPCEIGNEHRVVVFRLSPKYLHSVARWAHARMRADYVDTFDIDTDSGFIDNELVELTSDDPEDVNYRITPYFRAYYQKAIDTFGGVEVLRVYNSDKHLIGASANPEYGMALVEISKWGHRTILSMSSYQADAAPADSQDMAWSYLAVGNKETSHGSRSTNQYGALGAQIFQFADVAGVYNMWSIHENGTGVVTVDQANYPDQTHISVQDDTDEAYVEIDLQLINNNQRIAQFQEFDSNLSMWAKRIRVVYQMLDMTATDAFSIYINLTDVDDVGVSVIVSVTPDDITIEDAITDSDVDSGAVEIENGIIALDIYLIRNSAVDDAEVKVAVYQSAYDAEYGLGYQQRYEICNASVSVDATVVDDFVRVGFLQERQGWANAEKVILLYDTSIGHGTGEGLYALSNNTSENVGVPISHSGQKLWLSGDVTAEVVGSNAIKDDYIDISMHPHYSLVRALDIESKQGVRFGVWDTVEFEFESDVDIFIDVEVGSFTHNVSNVSGNKSNRLVGGTLVITDTNIKEFTVTVIDIDDVEYEIGRYSLLKQIVFPQHIAESTSDVDGVEYPNKLFGLLCAPMLNSDLDLKDTQLYQVDYTNSMPVAGYVKDFWIEDVQFGEVELGLGRLILTADSDRFYDEMVVGADHAFVSPVFVFGTDIWIDLSNEFDFKSVAVKQIKITVHNTLNDIVQLMDDINPDYLDLIPVLEGPTPFVDTTPEKYWKIGTIDFTRRYELENHLSKVSVQLTYPSIDAKINSGSGFARQLSGPIRSHGMEWSSLTNQHYIRAIEFKNQLAKSRYAWILDKTDKFNVTKCILQGDIVVNREYVDSVRTLAATVEATFMGAEDE